MRTLPPSTIYGFNGTFPGPRINAEYGKPVLVRFENHLDENPLNLDRQDFGSPDFSFLTHLHNGHTAPGVATATRTTRMLFGPKAEGYPVKSFVDNLYLNWPAGNDDREKQSFFWFHDHRMDHTGSNVYKGMVGLYPIYDPKNNLDAGDETQGLRLPGVRTNHADGTVRRRLRHPARVLRRPARRRHHHPQGHPRRPGRVPGRRQPQDAPGVVGQDLLQALPEPRLRRRHLHRQRHRVPGAGGEAAEVPLPLPGRVDLPHLRVQAHDLDHRARRRPATLGYASDGELQGQWRIEDGQQAMRWTEIADDGGLLPFPITRDSFELWPAKRREHIVDFTKYQDGSPTKKGDVIYLTNVMKMPDGRMWIELVAVPAGPEVQDPDDEDRHRRRRRGQQRPAGPDQEAAGPAAAAVELEDPAGRPADLRGAARLRPAARSSGSSTASRSTRPIELTSLMNKAGHPYKATPKKNSFNLWEIRNGGGGWVHPFHLHMEEHRTVMRNNKDVTVNVDPGHPDDISREDLVALDPVRVHDHLPRLPGLRRTVRRALPQPRARGPRHDVRLDASCRRTFIP